jgi:hypothetical protein
MTIITALLISVPLVIAFNMPPLIAAMFGGGIGLLISHFW